MNTNEETQQTVRVTVDTEAVMIGAYLMVKHYEPQLPSMDAIEKARDILETQLDSEDGTDEE